MEFTQEQLRELAKSRYSEGTYGNDTNTYFELDRVRILARQLLDQGDASEDFKKEGERVLSGLIKKLNIPLLN
jgi:hypothetical protein